MDNGRRLCRNDELTLRQFDIRESAWLPLFPEGELSYSNLNRTHVNIRFGKGNGQNCRYKVVIEENLNMLLQFWLKKQNEYV